MGPRGPQLSEGPCVEAGPSFPCCTAQGRAAGGQGVATHHGAELHHQQVGGHLCALGQALEQVAVL